MLTADLSAYVGDVGAALRHLHVITVNHVRDLGDGEARDEVG